MRLAGLAGRERLARRKGTGGTGAIGETERDEMGRKRLDGTGGTGRDERGWMNLFLRRGGRDDIM